MCEVVGPCYQHRQGTTTPHNKLLSYLTNVLGKCCTPNCNPCQLPNCPSACPPVCPPVCQPGCYPSYCLPNTYCGGVGMYPIWNGYCWRTEVICMISCTDCLSPGREKRSIFLFFFVTKNKWSKILIRVLLLYPKQKLVYYLYKLIFISKRKKMDGAKTRLSQKNITVTW